MIKIKRPDAPAFMMDPNDHWVAETNEAIAHYRSGESKQYKFKWFRNEKVKAELKKVFLKCAYCDEYYDSGSDGDIEHFRPKLKIDEKNPPKPGYYWLANDWDNLFLSCSHCNQRRKHKLFGDDKVKTYGKMNQFPLNPETRRSQNHTDDLNNEEPARLLINPCVDDPSLHLAYEDREGVIVPLTDMGKKSVEVFVLQRHNLVRERKKQMLRLFQQINRVKSCLTKLDHDESQKQNFQEELDILLSFGSDVEPFAGMSRFFIKKFFQDNNLIN